MKYKIEILDIEKNEDGPSIYLTEIIEDISSIPSISDIELIGNIVSLTSNLDESSLKNILKPFFSQNWEYIKFVNLSRA